jgi:chromosome segregation and condensation protein ScpB
VLFAQGEPVPLRALAEGFPAVTKAQLESAIDALVARYNGYGGALRVYRYANGTLHLSVAGPYHALMEASEGEAPLDARETKLLSLIIYQQPISLVEISDYLGTRVKATVQRLVKKGFIQFEKSEEAPEGQYVITDYCRTYFQLPVDQSLVCECIEALLS